MRDRSSEVLRPTAARRFGMFALALGLLAMPACGKGGKGTNKPGKDGLTAEQRDAEVQKAKQDARSDGLIDIANKDLAAGRYVSASKRAEEALKENPNNADAHAVLGQARWRAGDFAGSTESLRKAVELEPENYGGVIGLARNLQAIGQHKEAAELQERLLAKDKSQVDPYLTQLWSYYSLCDADNAVKVLDEIFQKLPADDPLTPLVQSFNGFIRPFAGKGALCQVTGTKGQSDANLDHNVGMKYGGAEIGGDFQRVVFFENREESIIDAGLAKKLKLKELGKVKPLGMDQELAVVLVPEVKFGEMSLKNLPALVQSLEPYEQAMGERPGLIMGRQGMHAFGTMTFDFPSRSLVLAKDAPKAAPEGAAEVPLLLLSMHVQNAPAVPIQLDGSNHTFWVYFGGIYKSAVAVTQKHYFKSGHLPREVEPVDDANAGLKMVYVEDVKLGDKMLPEGGGLVLVNTPPDQNLGILLQNTAFELGGYINLAVIEQWSVTYSLPAGKLYVKVPG